MTLPGLQSGLPYLQYGELAKVFWFAASARRVVAVSVPAGEPSQSPSPVLSSVRTAVLIAQMCQEADSTKHLTVEIFLKTTIP
ncbi:U3 small nucleolar RNA-associated protein 10, partial [Frankliniella fusca]